MPLLVPAADYKNGGKEAYTKVSRMASASALHFPITFLDILLNIYRGMDNGKVSSTLKVAICV